MSHKTIALSLCILLCIGLLAGSVLAAEVDCDATYCFSSGDFSDETITGICITGLPSPETGTVMLGSRVLRSGDILSADQLSQMTFSPLRTETDATATVTYLPIYENRVEKATTMSISIRGKEDKAPVAEDMAIETYKNLPNQGKLKVSDPEGMTLTYTLIRAPKRGQVQLNDDGTFTYTPKKNKVGVDSFVYTATDPAGHKSREATVTVQILKPTDSRQYTDTVGLDCRFEAEWLRNTGLFTGESISGEICFYPEKAVSRGDFLAMAVRALNIPIEEQDYSVVASDVPLWLKPYVAAALRSGLLEGLPETQSGGFEPDRPITGGEAAVMLQNALALKSEETSLIQDDTLPAWAADAVTTLSQYGIVPNWNEPLTRGAVAELLYEASILSLNAPGMQIFR